MEIQVNGQTYYSERDAKKAIAKAKREDRKREKIDNKKREKAKTEAFENFYEIVFKINRLKNREKLNWFTRYPDNKISYNAIRNPIYGTSYDTVQGRTFYEHLDVKPLQIIVSVGGDVAVKLQYNENNVKWYSIGIYENIVYFLEIPEFLQEEMNKLADFVK